MPVRPPSPDAAHADLVRWLTDRDGDLATIVTTHGEPPTWHRPPGFATLALLILEQQVSLAAARATFDRLRTAAGSVAPETVLALDDDALRGAGVSRQKARYLRAIADEVAAGRLDFDGLGSLEDDAVRAALQRLIGVGAWTAEVYLMSALRRADAWPFGDLALRIAAAEVKRLAAPPAPAQLIALAEPWRPHRATAARLLWHHYLSTPRRRAGR